MKQYKTNIPEYKLVKVKSDYKKTKIASSRDSYDHIRQFYHDDIIIYESFFLLLLNRANNTTGYVKISQGGRFGTVVDISIIAKYAVDSLSASIVLAHNHPSGNEKPSNSDINLTKKIVRGLEYLDITVLDHIILTDDNYYSFADEGLI